MSKYVYTHEAFSILLFFVPLPFSLRHPFYSFGIQDFRLLYCINVMQWPYQWSHASKDEKTRLLVWSRWMPDEQVFDGCFMVVEVEACIMKPHKVKHDNTEWVSWGGLEPFQLIQVEAKADYHLNGPSYWWTSIKSWFLIAFMNFTQVKIDLLFQPYPAVHFTKNIYAELFISQKHGCPSDLG